MRVAMAALSFSSFFSCDQFLLPLNLSQYIFSHETQACMLPARVEIR